MKKKIICYFLIVSLLGCVTLFFTPSTSLASTSLEFSLVNIQNNQVMYSTECKDKRMLVVFFSIYCIPCKKLMPDLNRILESFQSPDFLVVGINFDRSATKKEIKTYIDKNQIRFPVLLDGYDLARQHNVSIVPTVFILGRNGKIQMKSSNIFTYKRLAEELNKLGVPLKKTNKQKHTEHGNMILSPKVEQFFDRIEQRGKRGKRYRAKEEVITVGKIERSINKDMECC